MITIDWGKWIDPDASEDEDKPAANKGMGDFDLMIERAFIDTTSSGLESIQHVLLRDPVRFMNTLTPRTLVGDWQGGSVDSAGRCPGVCACESREHFFIVASGC